MDGCKKEMEATSISMSSVFLSSRWVIPANSAHMGSGDSPSLTLVISSWPPATGTFKVLSNCFHPFLVQSPGPVTCALTKNSKNANFCCKKGKTWKIVENVIYFSDLWTFKPNASIFILFTVETSLRTKFTQNTLMLKSTPKILQKLNFSGIKPYSLCSGQDWEQNQSI